jgi:hypothetical protein
MTTKSTSVKAGPRPSTAELQARIADLTDINDELLSLIDELRDITETQLMTFAANGYAPAAKALLAMRNARNAALAGIVTKEVQ